eukprot:TRINITY_DN14244_c0_g1_i1.p1 TRINITY_DN14244_c0_g1~~TRINITY_DN14244_c0_g1_i1.p1  ORF type:complete len:407 (+),score=144.74 TRINITY_DN14244_c0_g1_i1:103-1221(+)
MAADSAENQQWWEDLELRACEAMEAGDESKWVADIVDACDRYQNMLAQMSTLRQELTVAQDNEISSLEQLDNAEQENAKLVRAFEELRLQNEQLHHTVQDLQVQLEQATDEPSSPFGNPCGRSSFWGSAGERRASRSTRFSPVGGAPPGDDPVDSSAITLPRGTTVTFGGATEENDGAMTPRRKSVGRIRRFSMFNRERSQFDLSRRPTITPLGGLRINMPAPDDEVVGRADTECQAWRGMAAIAGAVARRCLYSSASEARRAHAEGQHRLEIQKEAEQLRERAQESAGEVASLRAQLMMQQQEALDLKQRLREAEAVQIRTKAAGDSVAVLQGDEALVPCIARVQQVLREMQEVAGLAASGLSGGPAPTPH